MLVLFLTFEQRLPIPQSFFSKRIIGCVQSQTWSITIHFRKFFACALQGLFMTPGRRLKPTLEKLERCAGETNPVGSTAKALLALVQRKSNHRLADFAVAIGASRDGEDKFRTNVDLLLKLLTEELANSGEWKLIEMANRHELKYILQTS